ncbi:hypothetical protein, partial [Bartonella sp. MR168JLCBS]|uniref:hypothetical protein n=1 Tax=Bartonella sp. MR168JLCBS TaxID=3243556 RepID=UPI0035CEA14D
SGQMSCLLSRRKSSPFIAKHAPAVNFSDEFAYQHLMIPHYLYACEVAHSKNTLDTLLRFTRMLHQDYCQA